MDELSCLHGSEGMRACDDESHSLASRENVLRRFPVLKGTPPDPRAEKRKRGDVY